MRKIGVDYENIIMAKNDIENGGQMTEAYDKRDSGKS